MDFRDRPIPLQKWMKNHCFFSTGGWQRLGVRNYLNWTYRCAQSSPRAPLGKLKKRKADTQTRRPFVFSVSPGEREGTTCHFFKKFWEMLQFFFWKIFFCQKYFWKIYLQKFWDMKIFLFWIFNFFSKIISAIKIIKTKNNPKRHPTKFDFYENVIFQKSASASKRCHPPVFPLGSKGLPIKSAYLMQIWYQPQA